MRALCALPALAVALLVAAPTSHGQDKKPQEKLAQVTIVDTVSGMSRSPDKDVQELRLQTPGAKEMMTDSIHVVVKNAIVKDLALARKPVAFQGTLGQTDVQVGQTGSVPPRPILAKVLNVAADKATPITEDNAKDFPPVGKARVVGTLIQGQFKLTDKESAKFAFDNGALPIALTGPGLEQAGDLARLTGQVEAQGRLRRGPLGVAILEVETLKAVK